jgi:hypothetical protein
MIIRIIPVAIVQCRINRQQANQANQANKTL